MEPYHPRRSRVFSNAEMCSLSRAAIMKKKERNRRVLEWIPMQRSEAECCLRLPQVPPSQEQTHGVFNPPQERARVVGREVGTTTLPTGAEILADDMRVLLADPKFSDVILRVGERKFRAHKLILAARSRVFATMFEHNLSQCRSGVIVLSDLSSAAVSEMLRYVYSGDVRNWSAEIAKELYVAADKYELKELREWCSESLIAQMTLENACDVAVLGDLHSDRKLLESVRAFAGRHLALLSTEHWKELTLRRPAVASDILLSISSCLAGRSVLSFENPSRCRVPPFW